MRSRAGDEASRATSLLEEFRVVEEDVPCVGVGGLVPDKPL